jgi:hypothetical protein
MRRKLLLLAATLALCVVCCEAIVRIALPQDLSGTWRTRDAYGIFVNKSNHTSRHQFEDTVVHYTFDTDGYRTAGEDNGGRRILITGDSFTFGWLLNDNETFHCLLQRKVDHEFGAGQFHLVNGGHGGWGTDDYVRYVETRPPAQWQAVIAFVNGDDFRRARKSPVYQMRSGEIQVGEARADSSAKRLLNAMPGYQWCLEHSHLVQLARRAFLSSSSNRSASSPRELDRGVQESPDLQYPKALFRRLAKTCLDRDMDLMVLTTGCFDTLMKTDPQIRAFTAQAADFFSDLQVPFFDLNPICRPKFSNDQDGKWGIEGDGHPSPHAAEVIADAAWPPIRDFLHNIDR